jgi:NAD(P)-dependent dehydrogenase (short-subunit alcohol dehydrogenase family)
MAMKILQGKNAFVTGAANGIGLGICRALARAGVNVGMADVEAATLESAVESIRALGVRAEPFVVDVSDFAAMKDAAARHAALFGKNHILINNAGVTVGGRPMWEIPEEEWQWILAVNSFGPLNGVRAFLPAMLAHGEEGHVVSTASIGGLQVHRDIAYNGPYAMTKFSVVAFSEALERDLVHTSIGVSVFCPALVLTTLGGSAERRPERFGGPFERHGTNLGGNQIMPPISTDEAGERVVFAIRHGEMYILTHFEVEEWLRRRHGRIEAAIDGLARFKAAERTRA